MRLVEEKGNTPSHNLYPRFQFSQPSHFGDIISRTNVFLASLGSALSTDVKLHFNVLQHLCGGELDLKSDILFDVVFFNVKIQMLCLIGFQLICPSVAFLQFDELGIVVFSGEGDEVGDASFYCEVDVMYGGIDP